MCGENTQKLLTKLNETLELRLVEEVMDVSAENIFMTISEKKYSRVCFRLD